MINIRRSADRGHADYGWLMSHHTFSFSAYHDVNHMGFRALRVMNEDRVGAGQGFGSHPHKDMEIVSYVLEGALEHKDSMGNGAVLHPGEFQRISAGTGITHSEFNPSSDEPTHFYQIWIGPDRLGHAPSYEQKRFDVSSSAQQLRLVASADGREGSITIHQDVQIYVAQLAAEKSIEFQLEESRHAWLQVLRGRVKLNGYAMETGDGAAVSSETALDICATLDAEIMLFDLC
ncbi:pirin family protein [Allorhodopirellula heiligendammensis]|uniref:Quercetin 2,3-dioxygenase n=1 Tax=Allorhodopirellula heiligendammensis TaxID=2714739 RepID=A0A5C6C709_9BACT|nr:pirin family protein [Allorhodopirellula heiligendammensis]TWU19928.1 Quercetin 2,3-dioxygenase [Allorhodopirellula heiligendammensis]